MRLKKSMCVFFGHWRTSLIPLRIAIPNNYLWLVKVLRIIRWLSMTRRKERPMLTLCNDNISILSDKTRRKNLQSRCGIQRYRVSRKVHKRSKHRGGNVSFGQSAKTFVNPRSALAESIVQWSGEVPWPLRTVMLTDVKVATTKIRNIPRSSNALELKLAEFVMNILLRWGKESDICMRKHRLRRAVPLDEEKHTTFIKSLSSTGGSTDRPTTHEIFSLGRR